jgi:hypothetical protein
VKICSVDVNARRRCFEVAVPGKNLLFPFAKCEPRPSTADPVASVAVDPELGREAFTYTLRSGGESSVHIDQVLEYNQDPSYRRDMLVYQLTVEAQRRVSQSGLSKREIVRRLGTSATQFYRLLDQTNYTKSTDQLVRLLNVLDCDVDFVVRAKSA